MPVEAARRIFPRCWLVYHHERRDENRNVGLGPEHDWSSHAADAFGYTGGVLRGAARSQILQRLAIGSEASRYVLECVVSTKEKRGTDH